MKNSGTIFIIKHILRLTVCATALFCAIVQAVQVEEDYKIVYRTSPEGLKLGVIKPDADGDHLNYLAQRYIYGDSSRPALVTEIQSGNLRYWLDDSYSPDQWTNFTVYTTQGFSYDSYGRKTKEWLKGENGNYESLTQYTYTNKGLVLCKARRMNKAAYTSLPPSACTQSTQGAEGPDRITRYTYNDLDQVLTETRAYGTNLAQTYVTNTYIGYSLETQTDANGNKTKLEYDDFGRLTYRYYPSKTTPGSVSTTDYNYYTYDANGNMKTERKRDGSSITYTYDNNNRLIVKDLSNNTYSADTYYNYDLQGVTLHSRFGSDSGLGIINTIGGFGQVLDTTSTMGSYNRKLSYKYDSNGNRTQVTYPDNTYFTYAFDGLNRIKGLFESSSSSLLTVNYWERGSRKSIVRTGGATTTYNPDNAGRLGSFVQDLAGTTNDLTNTFSYNPVNQITQLVQSNTLYSYTGNWNKIGTYTPNGLNQYTSINGNSVTYDNNGNLTKDSNDSARTYSYDMENRLVSTNNSGTSSFVYDPLGRLFQVTLNNLVTQFVYDGDALVAEYNNSNVLQRRYVHGDQVDDPWVEYAGSTNGANYRTYLLSDHQGSIIARVNGSGGLSSKLTYDSFGIPGTANAGRFGYTGQISMPQIGLYYYKARFYSPTLGRFLQTDPVGYADQMNLYAYVGNDPVNRSDPSGLAQCDKSLSETQCTTAKTDANQARKDAQTVSAGLKDVAGRMKSGKMTDADKAFVAGVKGKFGKQFGSAGSLNKLAKGLDKIANKIGEDGKGIVLSRGNEEANADGSVAPAYVNVNNFWGPQNKIHLNSGYFNILSDTYRQKVMVHEGGHASGFNGDEYYKKSGIDSILNNSDAFWNNADTYGCSVYPSACGY